MDSLTGIFAFLAGCSIGSFVNVCIHRIPRKMSVISPPSACPVCGAKIRPRDNIPLLSFMLLRGKCRDCGVHISWRYPAIELSAGLLTLWTVWSFGISVQALAAAVLLYLLLIVVFVDLSVGQIPDPVVLFGLIFGVLLQIASSYKSWWDITAGSLTGGGFLIFTYILGRILFRKESVGAGDIKLGFMLGIFLGIQNILVGLFAAYVFAAIVGGGGMIVQGKKPVGKIPFGPYLALGTVTALFFGNLIAAAYLSWIGIR